MGRDYIPRRDGALAQFAGHFAALLSAEPGRYGVSAGDASHLAELVEAFTGALALAKEPTTRSPPKVADKDAKRTVMRAFLRLMAQSIRRNLGVSPEDKVSLGLQVGDTTATPVPAPTTQPLLHVLGATPLQHTVRFADAATPHQRAKPPDAIALLLFCHIGDAPPGDPSEARFTAAVTRQPCVVTHKAGDVRKTAYYFARWMTKTGKLGPWSSAASMTIAA